MNSTFKHITAAPIGIFDSGLGGLSICKEIVKALPNESFIYLADSANAPYGEKSAQEIIDLSNKNTKTLLSAGCKAIVVACNTATTNAIGILRASYNVPFIGIEPATKPAALQTKSGKIGVLATKGTLKSDLFISTSNQFRGHLQIVEAEGENLVRLIEQGEIEATIPLLEKYLSPMIEQGVDNIVLGCTHYPFLIPIIRRLIPKDIVIVDAGEAVARQICKVLKSERLLNASTNAVTRDFYTNKNKELLSEFLERIDLNASSIGLKAF